MSNCEICDKELVEGEFEEKLGICVNCIMIESRDHSFRSFLTLLMLFMGVLVFIVTFLSVVFMIPFLFVDFESHIFYLIPPLIVCVISGGGLIYFSFVFKFR